MPARLAGIARRASSQAALERPFLNWERPEPVITLPASAVTWEAFNEHYFKQRPLVLRGALDLSAWSASAWVRALSSEDAAGSPADILIRGGSINTLSQRGNAEVLAGVRPRKAVARIFGNSELLKSAGLISHVSKSSSSSSCGDGGGYWQWRTTLGTLALGEEPQHPSSSSNTLSTASGNFVPVGCTSALPRCVPLPGLLQTWPGLSVKPDGESAVFATSAGGRTAMHLDEYHNTLLHLWGAKQVVLVAPEWRCTHPNLLKALFTAPGTHASLYGSSSSSSSSNSSSNSNNSNSSKSAAEMSDKRWGVQGMPRLQCCIKPGDLLYIPKGWLHDVESITSTVSAALRFEVGTAASPELMFASAFDM